MTTYRELQAELARLHQESERVRIGEKGKALERIRALIAEYRILPHELGFTAVQSHGQSNVPPKYRDPKTGATWTGRGSEPVWIRGKDRVRFEIG
jgi:DNA-binding protein H-NS